ncbi:MAG TPA: aldo/keto reductase [Sphingomicrobium sp.]|nr:aldo/keto reductase [Sphingomicrobium sp.]
MKKRALGNSDLTIAPLVLGGNVFGWTADEPTSFDILDAFVDAGGTMIDSADVYSAWAPGHSGGESETVIGNWLKRDPAKRDKVLIATKVGFFEGLAPEKVLQAADASLARLGIDRIDLYYQHKDDESVPLADSFGAFDQLRKAGKIDAIGLSQYSADRVREAIQVADAQGYARPSVLQTWYNLVERKKLEGPLLDAALEHGLGILPFYSLANGFLTGKYRSADDLGKSVRGMRNIDYLEGRGPRVLAALDEIAAETGAALATVALAWTKAQPGITAPIASATSLDQARDLLAALTMELTAAQIERLNEASD